MSEPFLIVGLPRSRTAWWSIAATTPDSLCTHEPLKRCTTFDDLAAFWDRPFKYVGVSDSGLAYQLGRILNEIGPRTIIIERPISHVERSLETYFSGVPYDRAHLRNTLHEIAAHLAKWRDHPLVKVVQFSALNDRDTVDQCFSWLMPENPYRINRELMHMNIQVDLGYALDQMRKPHTRWYLEA